jgi:hypothetical protein
VHFLYTFDQPPKGRSKLGGEPGRGKPRPYCRVLRASPLARAPSPWPLTPVLNQFTVKVPVLLTVPPAVVTPILPVLAPVGTVAVIWV